MILNIALGAIVVGVGGVLCLTSGNSTAARRVLTVIGCIAVTLGGIMIGAALAVINHLT